MIFWQNLNVEFAELIYIFFLQNFIIPKKVRNSVFDGSRKYGPENKNILIRVYSLIYEVYKIYFLNVVMHLKYDMLSPYALGEALFKAIAIV